MPFKSEAQRRFFHWSASKGKISPRMVAMWEKHTKDKDLPERVKHAAFLDELEKISADRSYFKDFLAGVDPTGGYTFSYGMQDAGKSKGEAAARKAVGVAGGLIGGATLVPAVVSSIIEAAKGARGGGLGGMATGAMRGLHKPFTTLWRAGRASGALRKLEKGRSLGKADAEALSSFSKGLVPESETFVRAFAGDSSAMKSLSGKLRDRTLKAHEKLAPEVTRKAREAASDEIGAHFSKLKGRVPEGIGKQLDPVEQKLRQIVGDRVESTVARANSSVRDDITKFYESSSGMESARRELLDKFRSSGMLSKMRRGVDNQANQMAAALALGGVIGGGSAFLQHGKGRFVGRVMTKEQIERATR